MNFRGEGHPVIDKAFDRVAPVNQVCSALPSSSLWLPTLRRMGSAATRCLGISLIARDAVQIFLSSWSA